MLFFQIKVTYQTIKNTGKRDLTDKKDLKEEILIYYNAISWFSKNTNNNNTYLIDE